MNESTRPRRVLRWTPRAFLLIGAGVFLFLGGVALRSPVPLFLALPLLLAGPAAALGGPRGPADLEVERRAEGSGTDVVLRGRIAPRERFDPRDLEVELPVPAGLRPRGAPTFRRAPDGLEFELRGVAPEPTILVVPPPRIVWRDATGLVERPARFEVSPLVVERYPPELVRVGAVRLQRTVALPGETPSHRVGSVGEFYGLREALPSDPFHRINWRASARSGRLFANEYELDRTGDVLLLLDARGSSLGPAMDERLLSIARAAAFGIAESFLREKARVGLGVFAEFLDAVPLGSGRVQETRIRSRLLAARLGPEGVPAERGAVSVGRHFPPGVTTILFSTLANESAGELVLHLRRRGYPAIVLSPSAVPLLGEGAKLAAPDEVLVNRIVRFDRRVRIALSWRDAPTVDWEDYWSLGGFVEFLRRPATRRVG